MVFSLILTFSLIKASLPDFILVKLKYFSWEKAVAVIKRAIIINSDLIYSGLVINSQVVLHENNRIILIAKPNLGKDTIND